ncbi:MAG: histidine kinase [Rhodobacterales bacterium 32-67-9]|nr:MAG: histidine kinase [Rhodobacterales bacterium 32-67-9]
MNGKLIAGFLVVTALIAGAAVYYLQVYAFYERVEPASAAAVIRLTPIAGTPEPMLTEAFEGIDAESSPLRFRGCFTTPMTLAMLSETYAVYEKPTPLIAPSWFACFDAERIGTDLETGAALAFLSEKDIHPGVDRVVAVYPDGRAYAWQQLNESADQ